MRKASAGRSSRRTALALLWARRHCLLIRQQTYSATRVHDFRKSALAADHFWACTLCRASLSLRAGPRLQPGCA